MISSLGCVGVHEDNHNHGRSCARAFGISIENVVRSLVFDRKIKVVPARKTWPPSNAAHEPLVFVTKIGAEEVQTRFPSVLFRNATQNVDRCTEKKLPESQKPIERRPC